MSQGKDFILKKIVSMMAVLSLLISTIITGMPRSIRAADAENVPVASWPRTIVADDATIVVYQPQAIV